MSRSQALTPAVPWIELEVTDEDWAAADPDLLMTMFGQLQLIRIFEEAVLDLSGKGLLHGPAHSSIGQEGAAVGSVVGLRSTDSVNGSHRGHHQFLAKAFAHVAPSGLDLTALVTSDIHTILHRTLSEILGLQAGFSGGRGGSMHLQWHDAGALGTNAIVGGGVPFAAGNAWAQRHAGTDDVTVTYFGDGAVNIGSVLETMNLAAAWKLPLCFFIENNRYAVSTNVDEATGEARLSGRGPGFGIPSWRVDGMNPLAVHLAMEQVVDHMRAGDGPTVVEAVTYRFFHQNGPFPGSAFGYRTKEEEREWRERDPLTQVERILLERGIVSQATIEGVHKQVADVMTELVGQITEPDPDGRPNSRRIRDELWPDPATSNTGIRSDLTEIDGARHEEEGTFAGELAPTRFIDVVAGVMDRRMATDDRILVLGEDVHRLNGGTNGATKGLPDKYPGRVLGTPISENAFVGLGGGIAVDGRYRPVVEFMYPDFLWVAADQVFNQIAKARHMFGGTEDIPLVLRTKVAAGTGYGSQHSMDPAGIFATSVGWRIVAPSTPFDYVGLMNAALAIEDPVLVIEHVDLYLTEGQAPTEDLDYLIPPGNAAVRREGSDVTVLTYLSMVGETLKAVDETGLDAEVIDLRWLDRASLDWETIGTSIRKTNAVMIVEQGSLGPSYGGWLSDEIQRRFFDWLDQPVERVTGTEASPTISQRLEQAAIARSGDVVDGLRRVEQCFGTATVGG